MSARAVSPRNAAVQVEGLEHSFGSVRVLADMSLQVAAGEFVALLGPSGCGKTTLLRAVAGLLRPDAGRIDILGRPVSDARDGLWVAAEQRGLGMVFQDYALWPHMRVAEIVAFPLEARGVAARERPDMVRRALERVRLADMAQRFPGELSGGQQQRVGLARAIVAEPKLLLFDEPLSNLDAGLRAELGWEIASVVKSLGAAAIYVTHDRAEALGLADRVAVLQRGRLVQTGRPPDLFRDPASVEIAKFLQVGNLVPGRVERGAFHPHAAAPDTPALPLPGFGDAAPCDAVLLVPYGALGPAAPDGAWAPLRVAVRRAWFAGERYDIEGLWGPDGPGLRWSAATAPASGTAEICVRLDALRLFGAARGELLVNQWRITHEHVRA